MKKGGWIAASAVLILGGASCGEAQVEAGNEAGSTAGNEAENEAGSMMDQVARSAQEAVEGLDLDGLSADGLKKKASELISQVASGLGDIEDLASAEKVQEKLAPLLATIGELKDELGAELPDLSSLQGAVDELKTKLADDPELLQKLEPLLEQVRGFLE